jgi:hypothetical protein
MTSIWRALLLLYPPSYRCEYGEEMLTVLLDVEAESSRQGFWSRCRTSAREAAGLVSGALHEHLRSINRFLSSNPFHHGGLRCIPSFASQSQLRR